MDWVQLRYAVIRHRNIIIAVSATLFLVFMFASLSGSQRTAREHGQKYRNLRRVFLSEKNRSEKARNTLTNVESELQKCRSQLFDLRSQLEQQSSAAGDRSKPSGESNASRSSPTEVQLRRENAQLREKLRKGTRVMKGAKSLISRLKRKLKEQGGGASKGSSSKPATSLQSSGKLMEQRLRQCLRTNRQESARCRKVVTENRDLKARIAKLAASGAVSERPGGSRDVPAESKQEEAGEPSGNSAAAVEKRLREAEEAYQKMREGTDSDVPSSIDSSALAED